MSGEDSKKKDLNFSLETIAKSSIIIFIGILLSKALTYFYRILIARHYGPEAYGLFSLSLMVVGWISIFVVLGLDQGLLRYISVYRGKKKNQEIFSLYRSTLVFVTITSILGGILLFLFSDFLATNFFSKPELATFFKLFSLSIPIGTISTILLVVIEAYEKINSYALISKILPNVAKVTTILVLIFLGVGSESIAASYILGGLIVLILSYFIAKKCVQNFSKPNRKSKIFKEVFSYSWPLMFFSLTTSIFFWTDTLFIGFYRTTEEVGFYNAVIPLAFLLFISLELFIYLFFPLINKEYGRGRIEIVEKLSKQVGKWTFLLSLPLFALLVLFPGTFINILFGQEYLPAVTALKILAVGALFGSLLDISKQLLFMKGKSKLILADIVAMTLLNILLNQLLIPSYGISGAALATTLSLICLNLVYAFQAKKYLSIIPIKREMFGVFLAVLVPSILLLTIRRFLEINIFSLILLGIFFFITYVLLLFLFRSFDESDKTIIRIFHKKMKSIMKISFHQRSADFDY